MERRRSNSILCEHGVLDGRSVSQRTSFRARAASSTKRSMSLIPCQGRRRYVGEKSMSVEKRVRAYLELASKDAEAAELLLAGGNRYSAYHIQQALEKI